ncbi:MAG: peptide chain release factor-like protein [Candidatus Hydrogenedentes bacterium]|nr:peptide chain release factor-like protein [Candidatus Hydrogenedentota bacterium]
MIKYRIPPTNEELLAECDVDTFRSSGPGGQNVNKRDTAVRLRHRPTGTVVRCQRERSQYRNKMIAVVRLREKLDRAVRPKRRRVRTAIPRRVRERILASKKRRGMTKRLRRTPDMNDL